MTDAEVVITKKEIVDLYNEKLNYLGEYNESACCVKDQLTPKEWYDCYEKIKKEVRVIRERSYGIDKEADEEFLKKLIFINHNGVARAGPDGKIGGRGVEDAERESRFKKLIACKIFKKSLEELIKNPCAVTGEKSLEDMHDACGINQFVLVNRIIAASTEDVSSFIDTDKFRRTFNVLLRNEIINQYQAKNKSSRKIATWYNMNLHIMKELRIVIKEGIGEDPDPTYLSMLPWYIWEDKIEKKIKK